MSSGWWWSSFWKLVWTHCWEGAGLVFWRSWVPRQWPWKSTEFLWGEWSSSISLGDWNPALDIPKRRLPGRCSCWWFEKVCHCCIQRCSGWGWSYYQVRIRWWRVGFFDSDLSDPSTTTSALLSRSMETLVLKKGKEKVLEAFPMLVLPEPPVIMKEEPMEPSIFQFHFSCESRCVQGKDMDEILSPLLPLFHCCKSYSTPFRILNEEEVLALSGLYGVWTRISPQDAEALPEKLVRDYCGNCFHPALISSALGNNEALLRWVSGVQDGPEVLVATSQRPFKCLLTFVTRLTLKPSANSRKKRLS